MMATTYWKYKLQNSNRLPLPSVVVSALYLDRYSEDQEYSALRETSGAPESQFLLRVLSDPFI